MFSYLNNLFSSKEKLMDINDTNFKQKYEFNVDFSVLDKKVYEENKLNYPGIRGNMYKRIYDDIDSLENLLLGNYEFFENGNNLEKEFLNVIFKKFLKYEKFYNDGDYCFNFYNPDFKIISEKNKISLKNALKLFSDLFNKNNKYNENKIFFNKLYKAFINAFLKLDSNENTAEKLLLKDVIEANKFILNPKKIKKLNKNEFNKKLYNGNYYELKKENLEINENKNNCNIKQWVRTNYLTKDFSTLYRNLVLIILGFNGYLVRSFIDSTGKYICLVVYHQDKNMKKIAEIMELNKKLDINVIDLLSFEPVNDKLRPLRLNKILWNRKLWLEAYPEDELISYTKKKELIQDSKRRLDIIDYIKNKVNFKAVYSKLNLKWNYEESYSNVEVLILEDKIIDTEMWNIYLYFLKWLYERKYQLDNEYNMNIGQIEKNKIILSKESYNLNKEKLKNLRLKVKSDYVNLFRIRMLETMSQVNKEKDKKHLVNIWDKLKISSNKPFIKFNTINSSRKLRFKHFNSLIWKKYNSHDNTSKTLFTATEILEIMIYHFKQIFNLSSFKKFVKKCSSDLGIHENDVIFPLHDYIKMYGKEYIQDYNQIIDLKQKHLNIKKNEIKIIHNMETLNILNNEKIIKKYKKFDDKYIEFKQNKIKQTKQKDIQNNLKEKKKNNSSIGSVTNSLNLNFFLGIDKSTIALKHYFGEKTAIYFKFLSFLLTNLYFMILLIVPYIIFHTINGVNYFKFNTVGERIFYVVLFVMNSIFIFNISLKWNRLEDYFNFKFGNSGAKKENLVIRKEFQSNYVRDLTSDDLNSLNSNVSYRKLRFITSFFCLLVMLASSFVSTIYIWNLKIYVIQNNLLTNNVYNPYAYVFEPNNVLFSLFEVVKNYILSKGFFYWLYQLVNFESHKYEIDHDNSLILKLSVYEILTQSFFLWLILLFDYESEESDISLNISEYYLMIYFLFYFFISLIKYLYNSTLIRKKINKFIKLYQNKNQKITNKNNYIIENINKKNLNNKAKYMILNQNYKKLNIIIEKQILLEHQKNNNDTIEDYLEIFRILSMTLLFGILIPFSYLILSFIIILEYFNDKNLLLFLSKRSIPNSYTSIGLWKDILLKLSLFAIITNVYFLVFIFFTPINNPWFVVFFIGFVSLFYIIYNIILISKNTLISKLKKRNDYIKGVIENNIAEKTVYVYSDYDVSYNEKLTNIKMDQIIIPKKKKDKKCFN